MNCDVLIIGGGIAGLSLASELSAPGLSAPASSPRRSVILVEAEPTLAYHTSSRSAQQLIPSFGPPAVQELTLRTLELIRAFERRLPEPVLRPNSFLLIGREDQVRREASGTMVPISPAQALRLCPVLAAGTFAAAGLDTNSVRCNAPALLEYHRSRAEAGGVTILKTARVTAADRGPDGWTVTAGKHTIRASAVVNAAGAWADQVAGLFGAAPHGLRPLRRTAAVVDVERPLDPDTPMVAAADDSWYFRPEGRQVLISPSEAVPSTAEDARPYPGDVEKLVRRLNGLTSLGITRVDRAWTGLRTEAADGLPVVGFDAGVPDFFWLAGQGGYGFQTSSGIAELAAGLLAGTGGGSAAARALRPGRT